MAHLDTIDRHTQIIFPQHNDHETEALLTFPALGDTVGSETRWSPQGNVTKDSLPLADELNRTIVVANRPFVGRGMRFNAHHREALRYYNDQAALHGERLDKILGKEGITAVGIFGESAGATHGLAIASQDVMQVTRIGAFDPIGWFNINPIAGFGRYLKYTYRDEAAFAKAHPKPASEAWYHPRPAQKVFGVLQMLGRQAVDISKYGPTVWSSDISYRNIQRLRDKATRTALLVTVPEFSMAMADGLIDRAATLEKLQNEVKPDRPAEACFVLAEGMSHGSINHPRTRLDFIRQTLQLRSAS